jgi:hypothetical protein
MVDALNPEMPDYETAPATNSQQGFEQAVDSAYRQFYSTRNARGPAPVALLSYASGRLSGKDREFFEQELDQKGGLPAVLATMKAARPVEPTAPLKNQLSFTITRRLMRLIEENPGASPENVLREFSSASHEAVLRFQNDDAEITDLLNNGDHERLEQIGEQLQGKKKALVLGCLGQLEEAQKHWSSDDSQSRPLNGTIELALNHKSSPSSKSPLSSVTAQLSAAPRTSSSLLSILLDFAQSPHRS